MSTITISLTPEQDNLIRNAVKTGQYHSHAHVVQEALRLWQERENHLDMDDEALKLAYEAGVASGEGRVVNASALLTEFKAKGARRG